MSDLEERNEKFKNFLAARREKIVAMPAPERQKVGLKFLLATDMYTRSGKALSVRTKKPKPKAKAFMVEKKAG